MRRRSKPTRKRATWHGVRDARVELKCEQHERDGWIGAARLAGYHGISDWLRDVANSAARRAPLTSTARESWNTPEEILAPIRRRFRSIGLDPCSNATSIVRARVEWILERDGDSLTRSWAGYGLVYVNPPYGRALEAWIAKIEAEARAGVEIIVLVPARPETRWSALLRRRGDRVNLGRRLRFLGGRAHAPFPSAIFYFGARREAFRSAFGELGEWVPREVKRTYVRASANSAPRAATHHLRR